MWPPGAFSAAPLFVEVYGPWLVAYCWRVLLALPVRIGGERPAGWATL